MLLGRVAASTVAFHSAYSRPAPRRPVRVGRPVAEGRVKLGEPLAGVPHDRRRPSILEPWRSGAGRAVPAGPRWAAAVPRRPGVRAGTLPALAGRLAGSPRAITRGGAPRAARQRQDRVARLVAAGSRRIPRRRRATPHPGGPSGRNQTRRTPVADLMVATACTERNLLPAASLGGAGQGHPPPPLDEAYWTARTTEEATGPPARRGPHAGGPSRLCTLY